MAGRTPSPGATPPAEGPRGLADPRRIAARRAQLAAPHAAPLAAHVAALRRAGRGEVPDFDPLDGGTGAKALFLLEKPGPMTDPGRDGRRVGSGFVSRDNDDPTAEAIFRFMAQAGLPRKETAIWNAIPWWNGEIRTRAAELRAGIEALAPVLDLLPRLRVIVLVGGKAAKARPLIAARRAGLPILASAHPSPVVRATRRARWDRIPAQWAEARAHMRPAPQTAAGGRRSTEAPRRPSGDQA